jgi:threonine/homoserine/homoserine lactone efflux protein
MHVASRMWRTPLPAENRIARLSRYQAFIAGLLTNLSNPKAALVLCQHFHLGIAELPGLALLAESRHETSPQTMSTVPSPK